MSKKYIVTPKGTAVLPFLFEEDKEYGGYKVAIRVDAKTAAEFKEKILDGLSFKSKNFHVPVVPDERVEGMWLIKTASAYAPVVFDSRNKPISAKTKVSGGSEVRAMCEVHQYEVQKKEGVKLRLKQVQVIKLVEGGPSAFDEVEDGFAAEEQEVPHEELIAADDL